MLGEFRRTDRSGIIRKPVERTFTVREQEVTIVLEDAWFEVAEEAPGGKLLDAMRVEQMLRGMVAAITHNASRNNPVPSRIVIRRGEDGGQAGGRTGPPDLGVAPSHRPGDRREHRGPPGGRMRSGAEPAEGCVTDAYEPRWTLDEVSLGTEARAHIESALAMVRHRRTLLEDWGLRDAMKSGRATALNFYGPPGTGKSMAAEAVAGSLGKRVLLVDYAGLESKFVGETPKNIRAAFAEAARQDAVLVFDEADSFLGKRLTHVQQSADYGVNITRSVMLMELERFEGVVVFTTNLLQNYDDAFRRRILAQVPFPFPDEAARAEIWRLHLPERMPCSPEIGPERLAAAYSDVTGADIKDMVLYAAALCLQQGAERVGLEHVDEAYRYVKRRYPEFGAAAAGAEPGREVSDGSV